MQRLITVVSGSGHISIIDLTSGETGSSGSVAEWHYSAIQSMPGSTRIVTWSRQLFDGQIYVFAYYCLHNLQSVLTIVLPLWLFYKLRRSISKSVSTAWHPSGKGWCCMRTLLALMIPLITLASFQPDFLQSYPTYRDTNANEFFGVPEWVTALVYEALLRLGFCTDRITLSGISGHWHESGFGVRGRIAHGCLVLFHSLWPPIGRSCFFTVWRLFAGRTGLEYPQHLGWFAHSHRHCLGDGTSCFPATYGA